MRFPTIVAIVFVFSSFGAVYSSNSIDYRIWNIGVETAKCAVPNFENARRDSKAIFTGKVVSESKDRDTRTFDFLVEKYWKGKVGKRIKVSIYETMRFQAWLEVGKTYLIFADGDDDGQLDIARCSRSKSLDDASDDLRKLGTGKRPK